jgi:hypothetical protein
MKLTDILRKINEEEEDKGQNAFVEEYDFAITPSNMQAALDALSDPENYVVKVKDEEGNEKIDTDFTSNFNDKATIKNVFGSSNPSDRDKDAMNNWNSLSPVGRRSKIKDIQKRIPEIYKKGIEHKDFIKAYDAWKSEGNEGSEEDFIVANDYKPGSEFAPIKKVSKAGTLTKYFPDKTKDNMRKYGGTLSIDTHYDVDGDKIVFPNEKNPFKTQSLLKSRIGTIMKNSGVNFEEDKKYQLDTTKTPVEKPKAETVSPVTYTSTEKNKVDKAKKVFQNSLGDAQGVKYTDDSFKDPNNVTQYRVTVTGLTPELRSKLIITKSSLKEGQEFDFDKWEMRQMLVRAGIIK